MTHLDAPSTDELGFEAFGLADTILKSIENEGFTVPTEIQTMAIPPLMEGNDLIGIAQTGGGKTAAFALPMINKLLMDYQNPRQNMPKVLILAPTRELAMQIEQCIVTFSKGSKLKSLVVAGGQPYPPQTNKLRRGVDVLVATPGRLIDHIGRNNVKFNDTMTFILDEADRMLDMGFIDDVKDISETLPEGHQTVLFSATMNQKVRHLTRSLLNNPVNVEIKQKTAVAETISHKLMNVTRKNKAQLLSEILERDDVEKALVFARTKIGADDLSDMLYEKGIRSDAIHGDKRQRVREKILMNFRRGRTKVLVATDVAARGIDVDGITHVINYELPIEPENYIHRVGRTGRAGAKGIAISFCDPSDVRLLVQIESLIKQTIEVDEDHEYHIDVRSRSKGKGGQGRFGRERGGRREGGFGRNSRGGGREDRGFRDNKGKSDRYQSRDNGRDNARSHERPANSDWKRDDRDDRRPAPQRQEQSYNKERSSRDDRPYNKERSSRDDRPYNKERSSRDDRPYNKERSSRDDRPYNKERSSRDDRPYNKERSSRDDRPYNKERSSRDDRPYNKERSSRNDRSYNQDRPARNDAPRYDPWTAEAKNYSDDPVLGKLLGKPPKMDSKREDKSDFVKAGSGKKKSFKKNDGEGNNFERKKVRGGKKILSGKKPVRSSKPKGKDNGGNKAFSPKRKTLKTSRAA